MDVLIDRKVPLASFKHCPTSKEFYDLVGKHTMDVEIFRFRFKEVTDAFIKSGKPEMLAEAARAVGLIQDDAEAWYVYSFIWSIFCV